MREFEDAPEGCALLKVGSSGPKVWADKGGREISLFHFCLLIISGNNAIKMVRQIFQLSETSRLINDFIYIFVI